MAQVDIHGHSRALDAFFYCCAPQASQQPPVLPPLGQQGPEQQQPGPGEAVEAEAVPGPCCSSKPDPKMGSSKGASGEGLGQVPSSGWSIGTAVPLWQAMQQQALRAAKLKAVLAHLKPRPWQRQQRPSPRRLGVR